MPYFAPEAPIPITSCAPRFAEMNASPVTQAGSAFPARKKSVLVRMARLTAMPTPSTATKYTAMIAKSIGASWGIGLPSMGSRVVRGIDLQQTDLRGFGADGLLTY